METKAVITKRQVWRGISLVISLLAGAYLIYRLVTYKDYGALEMAFRTASVRQYLFFVAAVLLVPIQLSIETYKWQAMMRGLTELSFIAAWRQVMSGLLAAFITPYRLGEYPARLAEAGLTQEVDWHNWREWLRDWRKWGSVVLLTVLRYFVWGVQLWAVLGFCGIMLEPMEALSAIATYYFCVTVFPSVPMVEVATKGGWALLIFHPYSTDTAQIVLAVTIIWMINTILPLLFAYIKKK